jgi:hypothetical protein
MNTKKNHNTQLFLGLVMGVLFGFFLQKGGVTKYNIIMAQLRLTDFTVLKIMLSAVIVTMLGISILYPKGRIKLSPKSGSIRNAVIGGLIFGIGFGTLGYCPGTIVGAIGNGSMDGLLGGLIGIVIGSGIFASMYSTLQQKHILIEDQCSNQSLFYSMKGHPLRYTLPFAFVLVLLMVILETSGL